MACDMIVAGDSVEVGQPELRLGIHAGAGCMPANGECHRQSSRRGVILTGEPITRQRLSPGADFRGD